MEKIKTLSIKERNYPSLLKKIDNPPKKLYYQGIFPQNNEKLLAVVGTRRPSIYGKQVVFDIVGQLIDCGIIIVSGMAPGIDTFAHQVCLEKKIRTIAVLGSGLNEKNIYPQTNIGLSREIIKQGGCLISEYPPDIKGNYFTFPQRNRIISGLSLGVLVVEAQEKSGSLITAHFALKQNKKLFAVPGSIYSLNSKGTNQLIKEKKAVITTNPNDILQSLQLQLKTSSLFEKKSSGKNDQEQLILRILQGESLYIDEIIQKTKLDASKVTTTLALMEISGKIRNLGGGNFSLN